MEINDSVLLFGEKINFALRELYLSNGYSQYRMSKFEEYDFYADNKDFLISDNVITFTDTCGKLMALKPDVTLSIIKNSTDDPENIQKVFYNENVYRISKSSGSFKEIMQSGVECIGNVDEKEVCDTLKLAANSLKLISKDSVIAVCDLGIISEIIDILQLPTEKQKLLYNAIGEKNTHEIDDICTDVQNSDKVEILKKLISVSGRISDVIVKIDSILENVSVSEYTRFKNILSCLNNTEVADMLRIDFSVISDINYYNGIVFKGYIKSIPVEVLSGGQYDKLMNKLGRKSKAIGFAVCTDLLDRFEETDNCKNSNDEFINVALPKGRLGEKIYDIFARAGFECPSILEPGRKLIFENSDKKVRYFWVKPSDVAIYVERGAADIGVVGKDILLEYSPDVYELSDLKKGKCRMAVAAPKGYKDDGSRTLIVATKFANIAKEYYMAQGRDIDIIHLNGSIEIAPILKLSDVIVDIVETGTTLKENDLEVIDTIVPISARLIANKASYKFKSKLIDNIAEKLSYITEE